MSCLYPVAETPRLNGINAYRRSADYLDECAANGGEAPRDLLRFLPWAMDEQRHKSMSIFLRVRGRRRQGLQVLRAGFHRSGDA